MNEFIGGMIFGFVISDIIYVLALICIRLEQQGENTDGSN